MELYSPDQNFPENLLISQKNNESDPVSVVDLDERSQIELYQD